VTESADSKSDFVAILVQRWKVIAIICIVGATAGLLYALFAPRWYQATLTVVPSQRSTDAAAMSLMAKLPNAVDVFTTDVQRIHAVLASNSVADEVIDRFNLRTRYGVNHREEARVALREHCSSSVDRKSGLVSLTCEDQEPKVAEQMASYFGEVGNRAFGRVSASSAREERKFLESQVLKVRTDVDESSRKLREFQERHKVVDLPEQSKATISAMASIQGDLLSKQLELSYLNKFSSSTEANVVQLRQQIAIMEAKLKQLEDAQQEKTRGGASEFFPGAMNVPALRFELEQLIRQQKIQETLFFLMTQRYETAKIDEARDTSTFQILDYPTIPTVHSRPRTKRSMGLGIGAGLFAGCAFVLLPIWWTRRFRGVRS
jgi:tyrosine-protein kinase Etk/Wzc